jgi:hypothetical protein
VITTGAFNTSGSGPSSSTPTLVNAPNGYGYVAKFGPVTASGTSLIYSTYFGGGATSGGDVGGLAGDSSGNAYITGATYAADFPATPGAYQTQCDPTQVATFCNLGMYVAKLNPTGTGLVWATYLGNGSNAPLRFLGPVVVDSAQDVYVLGEGTGQLPLGGGKVSTLNGNDTVYVAKLNPSGSQVLFGTTFGGPGNGSERAGGLAVDSSGAIYVGGSIGAGGSFSTPGAFQQAYAGGGTDAFVAKVVPFVVSNTVLAVSPATASFGQSVTLTANVTGPTGASTPTGTVTFNDGAKALGTGTLNASGVATYTTSTLAPNNYSLTAAYGGDATYSSSTSTAQTLAVTAIGTSTALTVAPNPAVTGQTVTFTAMVTSASGTAIPTGTVTFLNGTATLSAIAVDATGKANFISSTLTAATYNVTAMYSGDADHATSTSSAVTVTVTTALTGTTTALTASATTAATGTSITFTAAVAPVSGTGIPTGTVTFLDGATTLGTGTLDATGKTTYQTSTLAAGSHSITAAYGGDALNARSTSAAMTVTITAPTADFSLSVAPTTGTVSGGSSTTLTVTITPINGFSAATGLSCSNLPTNAACSFNSATVTPNGAAATSTLTITTNGTAAAGIALLLDSSSAAGRTVPGVGVVAISGLSLALVGWIGFQSRKLQKEWLRYLGLLFFTVAVIGGAIGCGGSSSSSRNTPVGSYPITVQATSGSLSHSATYTIIVSK